MSIWKKLFGQAEAKKPPSQPSAPPLPEPPLAIPTKAATPLTSAPTLIKPVPAPLEIEWRQFFEVVPIHESVQSFFKSFVGSWPAGLSPSSFAGGTYSTLVYRLQAHITGPYPAPMLKDFKPSYQMMGGKIARASSPFIDALICQVIPRNELTSQEPHIAVWRLMEKHSSTPLAKLLFTLPRMIEGSRAATNGKAAAVLVLEDLKIQVYKGIENVIFGAYGDLPDGGYLNDGVIDQKLRTLLPS